MGNVATNYLYMFLSVGAFQLYDINGDGQISYDEMLQIVQSIYKMTGQMVKLPSDEDTPEKVCTTLFSSSIFVAVFLELICISVVLVPSTLQLLIYSGNWNFLI